MRDVDYIKDAILNPLHIFENIMDTGFPNSAYQYVNTMYYTFIKILDTALPYSAFSGVINDLLKKYEITDADLEKIDGQKFKLDGFMSVIRLVGKDLLGIYARIASYTEPGSDTDEFTKDYRKLIDAMYLNPDAIYPELRSQQVFFTDSALMELSIWLHESMHTILYNLRNFDDPEKVGRVFVYLPKGDPRISKYGVVGRRLYYQQAFDARKDELYTNSKRIEKEREDEERQETRNEKRRNKEDLPKQVNRIDKESGCKLKHPDSIDSPQKFEMKVNKYKYALAKYLFKLNGMKLKKHIDNNTIFGMEVQNIELNKRFKKLSPWFDKTEVEVDDPKFNIRFISFIFAWTIRHLSEVAEICYAFNGDDDYIEFESKMDYVKYTVKRAVALADRIMHNESIEDDLLYFEELMMYMESSPKTKKRVTKNVKNLHKNISLICLDAKPFPSVAMYSQDIQMDTMVKLAYMVSTHDKKMRANLPFHEKYKFRKDSETKVILTELGEAIHRARKKCPTPPMFRYFIESDPIIISQFSDVNDNQYLATGVIAMKYLAYLANDENLKARVERII